MAEDDTARTPYERVRLYAELHPGFSLGGEILSDKRFRTEAWPRTLYALEKGEVVAVLDEVAVLREENTLQRQDLEDLQSRIEDLEGERKALYQVMKDLGDHAAAGYKEALTRLSLVFMGVSSGLASSRAQAMAEWMLSGVVGAPEGNAVPAPENVPQTAAEPLPEEE